MLNVTISTLLKNLKDKKSIEIRDTIHKISAVGSNVLLYGETGTGKDFWAEYLFHAGQYSKIVSLHCGDVPDNLLESEWFGYKKGAFTGADKDYDGKWLQAQKGILFLNRIDILNLNLQSKLLRIIERKKFFPLGSNQEVDIDTRFVFSTDYDIEQKVRDGKFREDLYYRIATYRIYLPPLRERKKDILPLFRYFAGTKGLQLSLSHESEKVLTDYPWHGNIRELENFVTNISISRREIADEDILQLLNTSNDFLDSVQHLEMSMAELEQKYISYLLKKYKNKSKVSQILQITRKSLYNKLNSYKNQINTKDRK